MIGYTTRIGTNTYGFTQPNSARKLVTPHVKKTRSVVHASLRLARERASRSK